MPVFSLLLKPSSTMKCLGMPDAAKLLQATLDEEKATDSALTKLAKSVVNVEAEQELIP